MFRVTKATVAMAAAGAMLALSAFVVVPAAQAGPGIFDAVAAPSSIEYIRSQGGLGPKPGKGDFRGGGGGGRGGGCWSCGYGGYYGGYGLGWGWGWGWYDDAYYYPRYRYVPRYNNRIEYCKARFKSYRVKTRTYTGYDGRKHYC